MTRLHPAQPSGRVGIHSRGTARPRLGPWLAIVPQKSLGRAKSRLDLPDAARRRLAGAMVEDTIFALSRVRGISRVIVAWEDPEDVTRMPAVPKVEHRLVPRGGLNAAISTVDEQLADEMPHTGRLVVPGDLPACSRRELEELLAAASTAERSFLRDAHCGGTTVLAASGSTRLSPRYGQRSAKEHLASGARSLDRSRFPSLTRDVDTLPDLYAAIRLGVGRATLSVIREHGLWDPLAHAADRSRSPLSPTGSR